MKDRGPDPRAVDLSALCKHAATMAGHWPLARMPRLSGSFCAASDGSATWSATGRLAAVAGAEPELWLHLQARADVPLQCQRCLHSRTQPLQVVRHFRFVRNEDIAARLDEESEEDVLALQPRLDLHELLEDELILALPIVPRHDECPEPLPLPGDAPDADESAPHPFAALAALRGRTPSDGD